MRTLRGKRVLVTGGAQGIGLAIGKRFADLGAQLLVADKNEAALPAAEDALRDAGSEEARGYALDVTDEAAIARVRARILADGGPIDVLVNNAGVVFGGSFAATPLAKHRLTFAVNLLGLVQVTHAFLPDLVSRPQAHIVNLASASGFIGLPYGSTYAASKWGVIGFSESLRLELELEGQGRVKVTTVCPSYVDTGLFEGARPPRTTRMVRPEELAAAVVKAVRRDDPLVLMPWLIQITPATKALLPTAIFDRLAWALGVTSGMKHWKGHDGVRK